MKIRVTLRVSDDARRCIAANLSRSAAIPYLTTQQGMATRANVIKWLEQCVAEASARYEPSIKLDPVEREETRLAVEQLRHAGWKDSRIKTWLLKQAALMEGVNLKLWEEPLLRAQPAVTVEKQTPTA